MDADQGTHRVSQRRLRADAIEEAAAVGSKEGMEALMLCSYLRQRCCLLQQ